VVSANFLAATVPGVKHEVFNVANGVNTTVLQIVETLNKILGKDIKPNHLPKRAGDVYKTHADISEIQEKIGYKPLVSFEEGMKRTVEYFKSIF
jgi:UDP-glucose 4-epimerase